MRWLVILLLTTNAFADPLSETRYCGEPERLKDGSIRRRADVLTAFKRIHPCPSTGSTIGPCKGWNLDHVIPLGCGGEDSVSNLQWLPEPMWKEKTKFERKIYCNLPLTGACGIR